MKDARFILLVVCFMARGSRGQYDAPQCPGVGGYAYIEHAYPCYFYACYNGRLVSDAPYQCPTDASYYQLLVDSGVQNACSSCSKVYLKPDSSEEEEEDTTTTNAPQPSSTRQPTTTKQPTTTMGHPSTTTMATDPPTDPAEQQPTLKEIHTIRTNSHVLRGSWEPRVSTLRHCLKACEDTDECLGFDFNPVDSSCWLHDERTICSPVMQKDTCIHFGLYDQCPATTPATVPDGSSTTMTSPTDSTTPEFTRAYKGHHLANGTVIPLAMEMATAENCVAICRMDGECVAADFDSGSSSCWLHSLDTVCGDLEEKEQCTHYRLTDTICEPTSPVPDGSTAMGEGTTDMVVGTTTSVPDDSGSDPDDGTDSGGDSVREDPEQVTDGFVESVQGYHVPGGMRMYVDVSLRQCLDSCLVSPYCLALDYDEAEMTCYFHFRDSYCGEPQELHGVKHYKRLPCITDAPNDVAATWYGAHAQSGQLLCTGCTLSFCLQACLSDISCAGLDFDIRNLGCYLFTPETVCGPLIPKDYCVHVSRDVCVPDSLATIPIQSLALINYPAPAGLPSGWQAFPGVRVRNGVQIGGSHLAPDQCVAMCEGEASCLSGDYDTSDGSCWLHLTPARHCGQVEVSDTVYHFKRDKCDTVHGLMEPYVSALWTSP